MTFDRTQSDLDPRELIKPQSGYVNLDTHLLQFLCHMTSDAKCSHMLFLLFYIVFEYY